jgi:hypothetical protein
MSAISTCLIGSAATAFPTSRLTYVRNKGAELCPPEEVVRTEVATRLGYDPFFVWAERTIVAQVWREPKGYRAAVQLVDAKGLVSGSRALRSQSDDCSELVKAAALAISISIDPDSVTRAPGPPPAADRCATGRRADRPRFGRARQRARTVIALPSPPGQNKRLCSKPARDCARRST